MSRPTNLALAGAVLFFIGLAWGVSARDGSTFVIVLGFAICWSEGKKTGDC